MTGALKRVLLWASVVGTVVLALSPCSNNATAAVAVSLTTEERAWLEKHDGQIRFAPSPTYAPVSFRSADGTFHGMTMDFARLMEKRLGFRFEIVQTESWSEIMRLAEAGRIDVVGNIQRTAERDRFLLFTEPYITIPNAIITRKEGGHPLTLVTMRGMKVAVVDGYATQRYMAKHHPQIDLLPVRDNAEGLQAVSFGRADAIITDLAVASHTLEQLGINNLSVAGRVPEFTWHLAFASRKSSPILNRVLVKGLAAISPDEAQQISRRWISIGEMTSPWRDWRLYTAFAGTLLLIPGVALLWATTLRRRVAEKTVALQQSESKYRMLFENANAGIIAFDPTGTVLLLNEYSAALLGGTPPDLVGKSLHDISPETADFYLARFARVIGEQKGATYEDLFPLPGGGRWFSSNIHPVIDPDGRVTGVQIVAYDITERKQAEEELRLSEQRFRGLFEGSEVSIWNEDMSAVIMALDGLRDEGVVDLRSYLQENLPLAWDLAARVKVLQVNQATLNLFGARDQEEMLFQIDKTFGSDAIEVFIDELCAIWERRKNFRSEAVFKTLDGRGFQGIISFQIPERADGFQSVPVSIVDITESKQAEEELRRSEQRFRDFAAAAADWFWEMGPDLRFSYLTGKVEEVMGLPVEEIVGKNRQELYAGRSTIDSDTWTGHLERIGRQQPFVDFEIPWQRPDGEQRIISLSGNPCFDGRRQFLGYRGAGRDVTPQKQAEEGLRQLQNYLANIIDSMPSMLIGVDSAGRVTQWNSAVRRATDIPTEDAVGQPLSRICPRLAVEMERVQKAIQLRQEQRDPMRSYRKGGETRFEDVTIYPLVANGVEGAVIRIDDVTERVRIEEMMVQSEKMLSVGGLAAGMAHEINNPLAGMLQTATVLAGRLGENIESSANLKAAAAAGTRMESIAEFMQARGVPGLLASISESGRRVAEIVENMLSFARKSDKGNAPLDLAVLLDKTLELAATDYDLKRQFDFKVIDVIKEYADDLPCVCCAGAKIQQVLLNILRNGAEAMQEAGTAAPRFTIRLASEGEREMVRIEIEDNGPGMDEATRKRIFEPFFTTKAEGVGTGLGLSVSYFIITENHGGEMAVESQPGRGARFVIRLPIAKAS